MADTIDAVVPTSLTLLPMSGSGREPAPETASTIADADADADRRDVIRLQARVDQCRLRAVP